MSKKINLLELKKLIKLANDFDLKEQYKEADIIDKKINNVLKSAGLLDMGKKLFGLGGKGSKVDEAAAAAAKAGKAGKGLSGAQSAKTMKEMAENFPKPKSKPIPPGGYSYQHIKPNPWSMIGGGLKVGDELMNHASGMTSIFSSLKGWMNNMKPNYMKGGGTPLMRQMYKDLDFLAQHMAWSVTRTKFPKGSQEEAFGISQRLAGYDKQYGTDLFVNNEYAPLLQQIVGGKTNIESIERFLDLILMSTK